MTNIENTGLKDISEFIIDQQSGMITGYKTIIGGETIFDMGGKIEHVSWVYISGGYTNNSTNFTKQIIVKGYKKLIYTGVNPLSYGGVDWNKIEIRTTGDDQRVLALVDEFYGSGVIDILEEYDELELYGISRGASSTTGAIIACTAVK